MILQNLVFPKENICNEPELYFHGTTDGKIPAGNEADLFTYFNSFSAYKWKMYTKIKEVRFRLRVREAAWFDCGMSELRMEQWH